MTAPSRREYVRLVLVLGALSALSPFAIDAYLPAMPAVAADLDASHSSVQATITGVLIGMGVGQLVLGPVSDSVGRRRPALIGVAVHVAASVACMFAGSIWLLIALRVLQGLAGAATTVVAMAVVRDRLTGTPAAVLFSRLIVVVVLAPIVSPVVGSVLLQWTSWRGIFLFLVVLGGAIGVLAYALLPESLPQERRTGRGLRPVFTAYAILLRDRVMVSMTLIVGLMTGALFVFISTSPFVYQQAYGLTQVQFALAFAANAVFFGISSQVNPLLLRRWAPEQILRVVQVVFCVACAALVVSVLLFDSFWAFGIAGIVTPAVGLFGDISAITSAVGLLTLALLSLVVMGFAGRGMRQAG